MEYDVQEEFIAELTKFFKVFNYELNNLKKNGFDIDVINSIFRQCHNLKANSRFIGYKPLETILTKLEDVFMLLRNEQQPLSEELIYWLEMVADYLNECWRSDCAKNQKNNSYCETVSGYLLEMVKVASFNNRDTQDSIDTKSILLVSDESDNFKTLFNKLQKIAKRAVWCTNRAKMISYLLEGDFDLAIIFDKLLDGIRFTKKMILLEKTRASVLLLYSRKLSINLPVEMLLSIRSSNVEIINKLDLLVKISHNAKYIKIIDKDVIKAINSVPKISSVVSALIKLDKSSATTRDIANLIKKDPILSVNLLKQVNNPIYNFNKEIISIQQAIGLFGVDKTTNFCLQLASIPSEGVNLTPYKITMKDFYIISNKRMELAINWVSKISFSLVPIVSTSVFLASIGQLVLANVISEKNLSKKFVDYSNSFGIHNAELHFFNTTTEEISSNLLSMWNFDTKIVDSIGYSYNFLKAKDDLKFNAIINHVIFSTIGLDF